MDKLRKGDLSGPEVPIGSYLNLRNEEIKGNPRSEPSYKQACCEAVGLGKVPDPTKYGHLRGSDDIALLRWVVERGSGCMWLPDSERTSVRGFLHRLITKGR